MHIIRYDTETKGETIKSIYTDIGKYRLLISLSETNWHTEGVQRKIPIWISKKGLFIYRLAFRLGKHGQ